MSRSMRPSEQRAAVPGAMHAFDNDSESLAAAVVAYALDRLRMNPPPLDHPVEAASLAALAGATITRDGMGGLDALRLFATVLAPACLSVDFPRFLAFVPAAPTEAAVLFDVVVGASSIYGGSWMEGAGAVYAENQALHWLATIAGLPARTGGCFVSGGTAGNLSALVAARHTAAAKFLAAEGHSRPRDGWVMLAASSAHSSIATVAAVMDVELVEIECDTDDAAGGGRLGGAATGDALGRYGERVFAVVATAGSTNLGVIDDLGGVGRVCREAGVWFHVDAAYGGAALAAPSVRHLFDGIEQADSLVIDPHKWLFSPFDCCALLYRDPELARATHTQHAGYLAPITSRGEWNPSDYAVHLSRRARGLPFWFSLATYGTDAYSAAVEATLDVAAAAAALIEDSPDLELVVERSLSVVVFRRRGWSSVDYQAWSARLLAEGVAFVVPTIHRGETVLRFCFVNPRMTVQDVELILDSLR